ASGSGDISGTLTNTTSSAVTVTFTITPIANGCPGTAITATVTVNPVSVGGTLSPAIIPVCYGTNSGSITLSGLVGTVQGWEYSTDAGITWAPTPVANLTTSQSFTNLTQPTLFRAKVQNGVGICAIAYSTSSIVTADAPFSPTITASAIEICVNQPATLTASDFKALGVLSGGDFGQANPPGWNGASANNSNGSSNSGWGEANDGTFSGGVSYGSPSKFMIANGVVPVGDFNKLETPVFSTIGLTSAYLVFNTGYNLNGAASGKVNISIDGGTTFNTLQTFTGNQNPTNPFTTVASINLSNYLGRTNLRLQFEYTGSAGSNWAVDNVEISSTPSPGGISYQNLVYTWTPGTYLSSTSGKVVTFNSPVAGTYPITVSTVTAGGCAGGTAGSITITVRPEPTLSAASTVVVCSGTNATITLTGLLATTTSTISYNIAAGATQTASVNSNGSGTGTFVVPVTLANNGQVLTITGVSSRIAGAGVSCPKGFTVTTTLQVNQAAAITAQPASTSGCIGVAQTLTMSVTGSPITYQWEMSTNGGSTWTDITGATSKDLTITPTSAIFATYLYRNKISTPAPCASGFASSAVSLKLKNVWVGTNTVVWSTGTNWSDGFTPTLTCPDVHILNVPNKPILSAGIATINNLIIYPGSTLTVTGATLQVAGTITGDNGSFNSLNGTLVLNGSATQDINGGVFLQKTINTLTAQNNVNLITDSLRISNQVSIDSNINKTIASNGLLILGSTATATANVGVLKGGSTVTGNVMVERYIPAGRKWRFLSIPTLTTQSYKASWMEGSVSASDNQKPGYGMFITDGLAGWAARGFDNVSIGGPTVKTYSPAIDNWVPIPNTTDPIQTDRGLMTFVRGDRSGTTTANTGTSTVLRTYGPIKKYGINVTVGANEFASVGNAYPSTISMDYLQKSGSVQEVYYFWDPQLSGFYGVGSYVTVINYGTSAAPDWRIATNGGGSYPANGAAYNQIQSGQAFFVRAFGSAGTVNFTESAKTTGSRMVYGAQGPGLSKLTANLGIVGANGTVQPVDLALGFFDDMYSNAVDYFDILKLMNVSDNVAFKREDKYLVAERHAEPSNNDTMHLWVSNYRQQPYQWNLNLSHMDASGRTAYLIDKYTSANTALNLDGETQYNFTVDGNPASVATDRFQIVFNQVSVVPVTFTSVSAVRSNANQIAVSWKVENEINIQQYSIERSIDGRGFLGIGIANATANNGSTTNYLHYDNSPVSGDNFYRIKATSIGGQVQYSAIVKVAPIKQPSSIKVLPNPVVNKTMQVHFAGMKEGNYQVQFFDAKGQLVYSTSIAVSGSNIIKSIQLPSLVASGNYKLQVTGADGTPTMISVFVE
ncbi:MAG: PKD-like domain-containing protein, partial [Ferruginibacter sp.]